MQPFLIVAARSVLALLLVAHALTLVTALSPPLGIALPWVALGSGGAASWPGWLAYLFALPHLIYAYAIYRLWRLLGEFDHGRYFSAAAVAHLRGFAGALIFAVASCLVAEIVPGLYADPAQLSVNFTRVLDVILALALFLIAEAFVRARRAEQELENIL